jgi:hypothetical protein
MTPQMLSSESAALEPVAIAVAGLCCLATHLGALFVGLGGGRAFGFDRLDTMLGGGLFRGSSTLITGVPGTSKTTLSGKFAELHERIVKHDT